VGLNFIDKTNDRSPNKIDGIISHNPEVKARWGMEGEVGVNCIGRSKGMFLTEKKNNKQQHLSIFEKKTLVGAITNPVPIPLP